MVSKRFTQYRHLTVLTIGIGLSLACAGVATDGNSKCSPLSYDANKIRELLSSWEGTYHIANWCAVGDCPPGERKTYQFIVDPQNSSMTWTDGTTIVRELDLTEGCLTGVGFSTNDFQGGHTFQGRHTDPNEEKTEFNLACTGAATRYNCMITISWEDPLATQIDLGFADAGANLKMLQGLFGIDTEARTIIDYLNGSMAEERTRSLDSDYKSEIWIFDVLNQVPSLNANPQKRGSGDEEAAPGHQEIQVLPSQ